MSELPSGYIQFKEKVRMVVEINEKLISQLEQFVEDIKKHPDKSEWNEIYRGFKVKLKPVRETFNRAKDWYDCLP